MWDWTVANFIVQCLILAGLAWYAVETRKIRMASQKQVGASQEQVEALHKPCLTVATMARNAEDAVFQREGLVGGMILRPMGGDVALQNIGTGPAFNVRYEFRRTGRTNIDGYLPYIRSGENFALPIAVGTLQLHEWDLTASCESLSGRKYETKITINNLVLTKFQFG